MRGQGESGQTGQLSKPMLSATLAQPPSLSSQFCTVVRASVVLVQRNLHQNAKGQGSETFWSVAHRGRSDGGRPGSPQHGSPHHALHNSSSVSCARFTTTVCQMCFLESCELLQQTNQTQRGDCGNLQFTAHRSRAKKQRPCRVGLGCSVRGAEPPARRI